MLEQLSLNIHLHPDATFATFIGSAGPRLAASSGVVWLQGLPGTGKSHLLQALCHSAENGLYLAGLSSLEPAVLGDLDHITPLCLDDVDSVVGNPAWEVALFERINAARDLGRTLVLASGHYPSDMDCYLPDLGSRLRAALLIETGQLTDEEKVRWLTEQADMRGFKLGEESARFLLVRVSRDMHHLRDIIVTLEGETLRQQRVVSIPFLKTVFRL